MKLFARLLLLLAMASLVGCNFEEPSDESGVVGTGITFRGTISEQQQLADNEIEIRAQSGERTTAIIGNDGQYSAEGALGSGPWLIRSSLGNDNYHYGVAYPEAIAHIHSYTDVVLRSWFLGRYDISDIDAAFESADTLPELPSADQFTDLAGLYLRLVEFVLEDYGLTGKQLLSEPFRADDTGVDLFLDLNPVFVDENGGRQITIVITDPASKIQTSTNADILLGVVEGVSDTQPPSMPSDLRVLNGVSGEPVLVWEPSTDNTVVIGYDVLRDGQLIATTPYPVYTDTGASAAAFHFYEVQSIDTAGNRSAAAQVSTDSVVDGGGEALSTPVNVVSVVSTTQRVELSWTQDRIDVVAGFNIYRGPSVDTLSSLPLVRVSSTSVTDATISAGQEYWYAVTAVDARGNESPQSEPLRVLTTGIALTPPESSPQTVPALAGLNVPDTEAMSCDAVFPTYNIDTELTPAAGCYQVEGDIVVDNFGVLKLQPGVVLKFAAGSKLLIGTHGRLVSEGSDDNPVVLTGQRLVEGWWWGVEFNHSDDSRNIISRTVIEYHGSNTEAAAGIALVSSTNDSSRLRVENSLIRYGGWSGIDISGLDAKLDSFKGNLVTQNRRAATTDYTSLSAFNDDSSFIDNDLNRLVVVGASIDEDVVFDDIGLPLQIGAINQVRGTIIINAGVKMYFIGGDVFIVRGNLAIRGTANNPVVLTSINETPGSWKGLQLVEGANAEISNVIIENGGMIGSRSPEGSNLFANDARMSLENVTLRSSSSYGYHETGNQVTIDRADNINIVDNARVDVVSLVERNGS
ncbi:fibronectin type III domain-containing protein [Granulosicoccus antarcticus]|uniref:Chitinase A1 n=1 Tax=Granulosicoccus antarcticus IMCC3135 TaxID=1192854 RepID=A0A2Z2NLD2_9GAMM|nr:hypothetical protein [Granulosicoccus antarcticus]ASJ71959.1 Chitinase A1 [Granulosicoccus antarcticus IMCC3135]